VSTPLLELICGDDPAAWRRLGFSVAGPGVRIGPVLVRIDGTGGGLRGWVLGGAGPDRVDGIPTSWSSPDPDAEVAEHPNGADGLDHVVVFTDSRDRTVAALVAAGGDLRRAGGPPELPAPMAFVRMGGVIVEVAENPEARGARLWGLVAVVPDVDRLARDLEPPMLGGGYRGAVGTPRDAVQPGRRIVTAVAGDGLDTAVAFMTPRAAR
jgi:hypothetical protein